MTSTLKSKAMLGLAVAIGAFTACFVVVPQALAAQCSAGPATVCYKGSTYLNVPAFLQSAYLAGGGSCGACQVSPN